MSRSWPGRFAQWPRTRRYANLKRIQQLDPERDYHLIYRTMVLQEFRFDMLMGLSVGFYRTYGIPRVAAVLDASGELTQRYLKRAMDTALLLYEMIDHGFDDPRGRDAVERLNRIHRHYQIGNAEYEAEYLYVLGALLVAPIRWLERYGWRPPCCHERHAAYTFYAELGRWMGIRDIPPSYAAFAAWLDAYERDHFVCTEAGARLMQAARHVWASHFSTLLPAGIGPLLSPAATTFVDWLLDERLRRAVGVQAPPLLARVLLHCMLRTRARILRLMPPASEPPATDPAKYGFPTIEVYPHGHDISELGPSGIP